MTAADLTLVGLSEDGAHLLLVAADGERFRVPLDAALRAAVRQDHRRPETGPKAELSPREVQALIRGGASADEVVELSGWSRDKIDKYEGPILAEREFVASLATQVRLRTESGAGTLLATRVAERLAQRGVDPAAASWDAWRAVGRPWTLQLAFPAGGRLRQALWSFDVPTRAVTAEDDEARWLSGEDGPAGRPAPFVPLSGGAATPAPPHGVYDVEADGGLEPEAPAAAVTSPPEPGPDLAPERLRTAARRHEGDEDADLEATMRERARARRRRAKAPAAPVQVQPVTPPAAVEPVSPDVEQHPAVETERPVAELPEPAPTQASSELGAAVDAVLAAAESEGRDPVAEVAALHEETVTEPSEPAAEDWVTDAVEAQPSAEEVDDHRDDVVDTAAGTDGPAPDAAEDAEDAAHTEDAEDDIEDVLDAIDEREADLANAPDDPSDELDDADAQVLDARSPVVADPATDDANEDADGIEATLAAIDAQEAAIAGAPDEVDAASPAADDARTHEPAADEPAPLDDAVDALVEEADGAQVEPASAQPPATGRAARRNRKKTPSKPTPKPAATPAPEPAPAQQQPPSRSAGKRKGRASVPSWDDIMFGPKG